MLSLVLSSSMSHAALREKKKGLVGWMLLSDGEKIVWRGLISMYLQSFFTAFPSIKVRIGRETVQLCSRLSNRHT